jgi:hypothetical protein
MVYDDLSPIPAQRPMLYHMRHAGPLSSSTVLRGTSPEDVVRQYWQGLFDGVRFSSAEEFMRHAAAQFGLSAVAATSPEAFVGAFVDGGHWVRVTRAELAAADHATASPVLARAPRRR